MNEKIAFDTLRGHLYAAKSWNWDINKMSFCDSFLSALNLMTGKQYGFSGVNIFVIGNDGSVVEV